MRAIKAFFMFWWEFLVGDTPEIFVGTVVVLLAVFVFPKGIVPKAVIMVLLVVATIAVSVWVELRRKIRSTKR